MSDTQEKSDDLIAELAKLMATNASGAEGGPKPTVIKLPPLSEATIQTAPVRIPGMDPPKPASPPADARPAPVSSAAPAIRIPGMERPAAMDPAPVPAAKSAPLDLGKPLSAPKIAPEPMSNWQTREAVRPAAPIPPMTFEPARPITPTPIPTRIEPATAAPMQVVQPAPATSTNGAAKSADGFDFDFGFGGDAPSGDKTAPATVNDPIADLIAAELDASDNLPARVEPTAVATARPAPVQPQAVVPRSAAAVPQRSPTAVAIKPVTVTPRPAESDRFAVAPVFGFNTKAASSVPAPEPAQTPAPMQSHSAPRRADLDPIEEIENLIGDAVRTERQDSKPAPAVSTAPVVPPLTTGFAPRRSGIKDADPSVQSAEAAIFAAAQSSGAEGRVDAPTGDDRPYKRMKVKPPKTSFISSGARQYVGIAVAGTLLLASGFGLYWVLGMNRGVTDTAPVLTADANPAKVEPKVVAATTAEPARSIVFDEIEGTAAAAAAVDETLVSRDETAGVQVADVARVVATPAAEAEEGPGGLANRRVRTVTVRPDGTIVSGDEAVAGNSALPVERPNVPEIAGAEIEPSDLLTAVAESGAAPATPATAAPDPIAALVAETNAATATPLADPAALDVASVGSVAPVFDASIVAPTPMPRPASRDGGAPAPQQLLTVEEAAAAEPNSPAATPLVALAVAQPETQVARTVDASSAGAYVQLASVPSQADAEGQVRTQTSRYGSLFDGGQLVVQRADLGEKGVKFRVRLPVDSLQNATRICASIKANGGDCFATNS